MTRTLYLLDGYSLVFRSYFAFIRNPLRNPQGENSSAVFGFFRSLFMMLRDEAPTHFAVIMDSETPTFRHEQYEQYKGTRDETPEDLTAQIPRIEAILEALGVPTHRYNGFEADDLIATLSQRCRAQGWGCRIITADKDLLQLVNGSTLVLRPVDSSFKEMNPEQVEEDWGVRPTQILDYLSLVGDSSDNIPGVRGIGKKTAAKLLQEFETLDGIYENVESISSTSRRQKLVDGKELAYVSRELVTLRYDVPLDASLDDLALPELDYSAALPLFREQGMNSIIREFTPGEAKPSSDAAETPPDTSTRDGAAAAGGAESAGGAGSDGGAAAAGAGSAGAAAAGAPSDPHKPTASPAAVPSSPEPAAIRSLSQSSAPPSTSTTNWLRILRRWTNG
jgi:DNA polymerase-1